MRDGIAEMARPSVLTTINSMLDELPRTRVGALGREAPAFLTCGVAGFYVALVVLFGAGLITDRSLLVLVIIALVSGLSFFAYTYLRRWVTGVEQLVLLEHVWFALVVNAGVLWLLHEPVLQYMDVIGVALCPFLAAGRVGCTLVGCCHGNPSVLGIRYAQASADDGFERHLMGVRLFPVAAIESVGLITIGLIGLVALPFASSGKVFAWYLLTYAIMRFGLEGIRGDKRPHWLGLSQARWMSIVELLVAVHLSGGPSGPIQIAIEATLLLLLFAGLAYRQRHDPRRRHLATAHIEELRAAVAEGVELPPWRVQAAPFVRQSSLRTSVVVSAATSNGNGAAPHATHASISLADDVRDLRLLLDLAVEVFPEFPMRTVELTQGRVLHVQVPQSQRRVNSVERSQRARADELYGIIVRRVQQASDDAPSERRTPGNGAESDVEYENVHDRRRYFLSAASRAP